MLKVLLKNNKLIIAQSYAYGDGYRGDYGFNLALHTKDNAMQVLRNRATFLTLLNQQCNNTIKELHWLNQIHGNDCYQVKYPTVMPPNADALITNKKNIGLCIMTADCVPIVLFNDDIIANIHAGWQGLVKGIIKNTVDKFDNDKPIYAYIGACISGGCYEIPTSMADEIALKCQHELGLPLNEIQKTIELKNQEKALFSVGELAKLQLQSLGAVIINKTIDCTYNGNYFSHRKATHEGKENTGRMAMVVAMI